MGMSIDFIDRDRLLQELNDKFQSIADINSIVIEQPEIEAIPKADYEARLKADMVAMLTEIQLEIEEKASAEGDWIFAEGERVGSKLIQQKIDVLKKVVDDGSDTNS